MIQPATLSSDARPTSGPATLVASEAPAPEQTFESAKAGLKLRYPPDWAQKKSSDDALLLVPAKGPADRSITLDVPNVPLHLPGAMTMPLIENGFVDDLRKHHPGLKVEEAKDQTIANSKARLVRSTWKESGKELTDVALLIVHADKVYILSLDCAMADYTATRAAMDKIASTIQWTK